MVASVQVAEFPYWTLILTVGMAWDWGTSPVQRWWRPLVVIGSIINNCTVHFGIFYVMVLFWGSVVKVG